MQHIVYASFWLHDLWHPLVGRGYQFWSGIGSDFAELTLVGALIAAWRHINCHVPRCLRRGHYPIDGTPYKTCAKHHPGIPDKPRLQDIQEAYNQVNGD